jgi:hypothetical protein
MVMMPGARSSYQRRRSRGRSPHRHAGCNQSAAARHPPGETLYAGGDRKDVEIGRLRARAFLGHCAVLVRRRDQVGCAGVRA